MFAIFNHPTHTNHHLPPDVSTSQLMLAFANLW